MSHHNEYRQWPFLNQDEFELASAFFDQKYVNAKLGPTRRIFKVRTRRTLTTGASYLEIIRLLELPEDDDELSLALGKLNGVGKPYTTELDMEMDVDIANEDADQEALQTHASQGPENDRPPIYALYSHQPYVTYEVHLHATYMIPTLWFTLHDLPMGEPAFDLDSVYRYLVPPEYKSQLRTAGVTGGISAAPHPLTDVPAFFVHPCQTKESLENFDCSLAEYMMVWMGLVGGCVGLWVPPEMAESES